MLKRYQILLYDWQEALLKKEIARLRKRGQNISFSEQVRREINTNLLARNYPTVVNNLKEEDMSFLARKLAERRR